MTDLSLFQEEYKPGRGSDFNCVKSTEEIAHIILEQGLGDPDLKILHEELCKEDYEFMTAEGVVMWKLKEKD